MTQTITVPIFPLDGVLLVPGSSLRLYIFEPRYQEMLAWALEHDHQIAMAIPAIGHSAANEHHPPIHKIAGLGKITDHVLHPNGHADIELKGISRIRITDELPQAWDFRVVQAELLAETESDADAIQSELSTILGFLRDVEPKLYARLNEISPQRIIDIALVRLPINAEVKLQIYSEPVPLRRLRMINHILEQGKPRWPGIEIGPDDPRRN